MRGLGQSQQGSGDCLGCFVQRQVQQCSGEGSGEKKPEKVWEDLCKTRSGRVWEKIRVCFGAKPGQLQRGSGECSGGFGTARSGSTRFADFYSRKPS